MIAALPRRPVRRPDAHRLLLRALMERLPDAGIVATTSTPWASITFTGARHSVALTLPSLAAARGFAAAAPELDFQLRGHVVADLTATVAEGGGLIVEALTVEEA